MVLASLQSLSSQFVAQTPILSPSAPFPLHRISPSPLLKVGPHPLWPKQKKKNQKKSRLKTTYPCLVFEIPHPRVPTYVCTYVLVTVQVLTWSPEPSLHIRLLPRTVQVVYRPGMWEREETNGSLGAVAAYTQRYTHRVRLGGFRCATPP
ncbi:hypothetical protein BU24DRAFT_197132 [Aaosphaeria arxii CBS 175.79]|uniref:Uncharacterized protein n=1 Tax=Aaosphaeria arxii CBS 175.79 TaxID=1450172 RepID=A0A6A5XTF9_9PLEO|nr:uncharacterized protein BU24DRAFT_197132 [Aaosphaeria arxii CBS 175.79]KAF2016233.1 hypothetical protein BU24DRAFT_197132 [Aaosphaeria arxii CBS 175.79]